MGSIEIFSFSANRFAHLAPLIKQESDSTLLPSEETDMFYVKNVPNWERVLRIILGIMALVFPVMSWGKSDLAVAAGVMSAILSMTGLMGFCPMCAMVGRKLDKRN